MLLAPGSGYGLRLVFVQENFGHACSNGRTVQRVHCGTREREGCVGRRTCRILAMPSRLRTARSCADALQGAPGTRAAGGRSTEPQLGHEHAGRHRRSMAVSPERRYLLGGLVFGHDLFRVHACFSMGPGKGNRSGARAAWPARPGRSWVAPEMCGVVGWPQWQPADAASGAHRPAAAVADSRIIETTAICCCAASRLMAINTNQNQAARDSDALGLLPWKRADLHAMAETVSVPPTHNAQTRLQTAIEPGDGANQYGVDPHHVPQSPLLFHASRLAHS